MAQGFFRRHRALPGPLQAALPAVLRLDTGRLLDHRRFDTEAARRAWSGFVVEDDGVEVLRCGWSAAQIEALDLTPGSADHLAGARHELVAHLAAGGALPLRVPLSGYATATLVSGTGHLLTNHHLVTGALAREPLLDRRFRASGPTDRFLRASTEGGDDLGPVRLCYVDEALDFAVLQLVTPPAIRPLPLRDASPRRHERVWQWGYPHRSGMGEAERRFLGEGTADHGLRYSPGLIVSAPGGREWFTDAAAVFGSSGSAVLDDDGCLVGVYRGGGAPELGADRLRYRRVIDVAALRAALPAEVFAAG